MRKLALLAVAIAVAAPPASFAAKPFVIRIDRNQTCNEGEVGGTLRIGDGPELARTLELPWGDDKENKSHIQPGTYKAFIRADGQRGWRIELKDVPKHENIQLHVGNYASNTKGCVLVGKSLIHYKDTCALKDPKPAFSDIQAAMAKASDNGVSSQHLEITVIITGGGS